MPPQNPEVLRPEIATLKVLIKAMDDKFTLLLAETDKRTEQRFLAQQAAVAAALAASEKAVTKAELASEKRFESINEFRQSLDDQTRTYMPRSEYTVQHAALAEKMEGGATRITAAEKAIGEIRERGSGRHDVWAILTTVIAILIAVGSLFIHFKSG